MAAHQSDPEAPVCATSAGGGGTAGGGSPIILGDCAIQSSTVWRVQWTIPEKGGSSLLIITDPTTPSLALAPYGVVPGAPIYETSTSHPTGPWQPVTWIYENATGMLRLSEKTGLCMDAGTSFGLSCADGATAALPFCSTSLPASARAADLTKRMDISEKILMLTVMDRRSNGVPRLGVPALPYGEALHGVCAKICGQAVVLANGTSNTGCATSFPHALHTGSSFNRSLFSSIGRVIGVEARSLANQYGTDAPLHAFAPNVQVALDPR